jgi:ElaB/YqjD/DUF883 family membrane-anchored ribosome-binding protein
VNASPQSDRTDVPLRTSHERSGEVSDNVSEKMRNAADQARQAADQAKQAAAKRSRQMEQAAISQMEESAQRMNEAFPDTKAP